MIVSICRAAVSAANFTFDRLYDYRIPEELEHLVQPGMRILVPFGRGNRSVEAFAVQVTQTAEVEKCKEIQAVLDTEPVLDENRIHLAAWMCSSLYCTFFDCAKAMLPSGLWFRHEEWYALADSVTEAEREALSAEEPILGLFSAKKRRCSRKEIQTAVPESTLARRLNELCKRDILRFSSSFSRKIGDKSVKMLALDMPADQAARRAERGRSPVRLDIVGCLADGESYSRQELMYQTGASAGVINTMIRQGILRQWEEEAFRMPDFSDCEQQPIEPLTPAQEDAYRQIAPLLDSPQPEAALLYGVTGSGKTQVYLHLIARALEQGKGAIVLVPEIGLTPQMIRRFVCCFGPSRVAVLHSALSAGERYDSWKRISSGAAQVVVGTRSAVFAPVPDLGLLVIDEEQDDAYKSEQSPCYHAREIAKYRVMQEKALLVFGSATPSVETFYGAREKRYPMAVLRERYAGTQLPQVILADMRAAARQGSFGSIGPVLHDAIADTLKDGQQAILFLNRRGAARQVTCTACGWTPECPSCSVSLTYHSANNRLMCHYCGHSAPLPRICPGCGSAHLKTEGAGTQRVEQELQELFPQARISRMDADTTRAKNAHEKLLSEFAGGNADILLGTQMVTKGLDFDRVALVGVIDADQMLFAQDYRARERTFSLLTQVVGRAGRRETRGRAVIQTYVPNHEVILNAARQDYERFYEQEIALRQALQCPPAAQIVTLTASAESERDALEALVFVKKRIEGLMNDQFADFRYPVLGPAPAVILRVMNRYRYRLTIRCPDNKRRRELIGGILREFAAKRAFRTVALFADVNPLEG
ncbi:MAG: primosomal protein N' [Eubacteriales bacterium]|nr:primosomal protein N' [Eubacteriales bacterium]